jgi:hypothetical protein
MMSIMWYVVWCSLVEIDRRFRCAYFLHSDDRRPDDGGSKHLWNVYKFLPEYTTQHSRGQFFLLHGRENLKSNYVKTYQG